MSNISNTDINKINIAKIRQDFPILNTKAHGKDLIYFDNAASSQKPLCVIDSIIDYYKNHHANIHRAFHYLGDTATDMYELARDKVKEFINAEKNNEIIFTRGTTESINLVATSLGRSNFFNKQDEIILSVLEHHSNIVPWQLLAQEHSLNITAINLNNDLTLNLEELFNKINNKTKVIALSHVSNSLGIINPIKDIIKKIRNINQDILILIDGAQAVPNFKIDIQALDCDFYAFSGHKMYGPTGIGVLYGKETLLNKMTPYQGGGEMIDLVKLPMGTTWANLPQKFEAGTPNIAGAIGLGAAIDYLNKLDFAEINIHKQELLKYCTNKLLEEFADNITIYGDKNLINKTAVISFNIYNLNSQDVGILLDQYGIAVRTGHHCNMPLMEYLNANSTIRVSFGIYNTIDEIDYFIESLKKVVDALR